MEGFFCRSGVSNYFFIIVIISTPLRSTLSNKKEKRSPLSRVYSFISQKYLYMHVSFYCTTLTRMQLRLIWTLNGAACQFIKVWKVPFSSIFHLDIEIFPPLTSVKCMFGKYKKIFSIRSISNLPRFLKQCQTTANRTLPFICKDSFVCSQDVFLFFIKTINKFWYESFLLYLSPSHA